MSMSQEEQEQEEMKCMVNCTLDFLNAGYGFYSYFNKIKELIESGNNEGIIAFLNKDKTVNFTKKISEVQNEVQNEKLRILVQIKLSTAWLYNQDSQDRSNIFSDSNMIALSKVDGEECKIDVVRNFIKNFSTIYKDPSRNPAEGETTITRNLIFGFLDEFT